MTTLPRRQKQLYDLLIGRGDVPIIDLYEAMEGPASMADNTRRQIQWLNPYIRRLNKHIEGENLRVEPGSMKKTYRLVAV